MPTAFASDRTVGCTQNGETNCDGACINLQTNGYNCGTCGNSCDVIGGEVCQSGSCVMVICGLPYSNEELNTTRSGGTPYGPTRHAGTRGEISISKEEKQLCIAAGSRLASIAAKLS